MTSQARTFPRREQAIRAERFADLGLAQTLPDPTPESLRDAVERALGASVPREVVPRLDGHRTVCEIAAELIYEEPAARRTRTAVLAS